MRKGWEIKKWNEVLEIRSGRNQSEVECEKGEYPILGSAGKVMGYAKKYISDEGSILIGRKGTIDNPLFIPYKYWNVDTAFGIHALESIDNRFLYYFCKNYDFTKEDKGSGRPSLVKADLLKIEIPVPPLSVQHEIVAILDDAFESIERAKSNAEQNLKNAKQLFESYIQKLITNITEPKIISLADACIKITQGPNPKYDKLGEDNFRVLKTKDIYDKVIHYEKADKISKIVFESCKSSELKDGDILIAIVGQGSINKCNVFENKSNKRYLFTRALGLIRTNQQILLPHFVKIFLQTKQGKNMIDSGINGTSGQQVVTTTHLKSIQIPLPTIEEQLKIINKIDSFKLELYKIESIYQQKIYDLEELKKSILQKAFNGELKTSKISA